MSEFQPSMFESSESSSSSSSLGSRNPRQAVIDRVTERAGEAFRAAFWDFVIEYARIAGAPFSAEDLHEIYAKMPCPQPQKWQAAGGVIQKLVREGKLRQVDYALSKVHGNPLRTYLGT